MINKQQSKYDTVENHEVSYAFTTIPALKFYRHSESFTAIKDETIYLKCHEWDDFMKTALTRFLKHQDSYESDIRTHPKHLNTLFTKNILLGSKSKQGQG